MPHTTECEPSNETLTMNLSNRYLQRGIAVLALISGGWLSTVAQNLQSHSVVMKACPLLVHFALGNTNFFGDRYILRLGIDTSARARGFLAVDLAHGQTNSLAGFYNLSSDDFTPPLDQTGEFNIDLPPFVDEDHDGIHDFFQQKSTFNVVQTSGTFRDSVGGPHILLATWSRPASGGAGIVEFEMASQALGLTITFRTTFEVYYFLGNLNYTQGKGNGSVALYRYNQAQQFFTGNLPFSHDQNNNLTLEAFSFVDDEGLQAFHYVTEPLAQNNGAYSGYLHFDYATDRFLIGPGYSMPWQVAIYDPQLSTVLALPRPPTLSVTGSGSNRTLLITGNPGSSYVLEQSTNGFQNWSLYQNINLTYPSLTMPFVPGTEASFFLRLRTR